MCLRFLGCIHLVLALFNVQAQEVGVDICACQPAYYSMTLQFNLTCDDRTIHEDDIDGVEETQCLILPRGGIDVTDFVPVAVREIQVLEITREDVVIKSTVFDDGYSDGDSIEFESFLVTDPGAVNKLTLPKIISMTIIGENAAGQTLFHLLAISYDNSCDTFPVISAGARIGWIVFTGLRDPPWDTGVCPFVTEPPVMTPTGSPTEHSTEIPTISPPSLITADPTDSPVTMPPVAQETTPAPVADVKQPTILPTFRETPTIRPSDVKIQSLPPAPVDLTDAPTEGEFIPPTSIPTCAPTHSLPEKKKKGQNGDLKGNRSPEGDINVVTKESVKLGMKRRDPDDSMKRKNMKSSKSKSSSKGVMEKLKMTKKQDRYLMVGPRPPMTSPPFDCPEY